MSLQRQLTILVNSQEDINLLEQESLQLCLAMGVVANGQTPTFNTVWYTFPVALVTGVGWIPRFAVNWTTTPPTHGTPITPSGKMWFDPTGGQGATLMQDGTWTLIPGPTSPSQITVVSQMVAPNNEQVYIIIGLIEGENQIKPIFVDPNPILPNVTATYQLTEHVQWWYDSAAQSSTTFTTGYKTPVDGAVFGEPNFLKAFQWVGMYHPARGYWDKAAVGPVP